MMILWLLSACSDGPLSGNDYSTSICTAIEECELLPTYGYPDITGCVAAHESALSGTAFKDEHGDRCENDLLSLTCDALVEGFHSISCEQWIGQAE